jgi:hypothetical protein
MWKVGVSSLILTIRNRITLASVCLFKVVVSSTEFIFLKIKNVGIA